jgi:hypothetical protein
MDKDEYLTVNQRFGCTRKGKEYSRMKEKKEVAKANEEQERDRERQP